MLEDLSDKGWSQDWLSKAEVAGSSHNNISLFGARALDKCGQVMKGAWGMSWHQEAMKGVEVCDKLGGADKQVMIPGFLNWHVVNT